MGTAIRFDPRATVPAWGQRHRATDSGQHARAGHSGEQAAAIVVPVLVGAAEIDVIPDIEAERATYSAAQSVETMRLAETAHMHNFANSREQL
jgi:hypothetical protein